MNARYSCVIVDDEVAYQKILTFFIQKIDCLVLMGNYGDTAQAAKVIEEEKPDIVFLDVNISGLEGPEFINALDHQPHIIIVSGHTEEFVNTHYQLDYVAYIQKPVDPDKLEMALSKL